MALSLERRKELRTQMRKNLRKTFRQKGAAKAAGATGYKNIGTVKGAKYRPTMANKGLSKEELEYLKGVKDKYKKSGVTKKIAQEGFKQGTKSKALVDKAKNTKMKGVKEGGTVKPGSHSAPGAARKEAKEWRTGQVDKLKAKYNIGKGSTAKQREQFKNAREKVVARHKKMIGK